MRIVSIAPYMPYPGIPHAGGDLYRRHTELVASVHDLVVICPATADNEFAVQRDPRAPFRRLLIVRSPRSESLWRSLVGVVLARVAPFLVLRSYRHGLSANEEALAALRAADRVELQWFDAVLLAGYLKRVVPHATLVGVFHDVISQAQGRMLRTRQHPVKRKVLALVQAVLTIPLERRAMRLLDVAAVLSDKDRTLLARRGGSARIDVLEPPLEDEEMPDEPRRDRRGQEVLFVGALWRIENEDAALWLVRDIWPLVRSALPGARLTLAGAAPTGAILEEVSGRDGVRITGQVPSLAPYYERAAVVAAPMRLGAGVKLKSVVAMLWGIPVVATSVAAEGIDGPDVFAAVADDRDDFAQALIRVLTCPRDADEAALRAYEWSHRVYSRHRYGGLLERLYACGW